MNLAIDIGNTNIKAAAFNGSELVEVCVQAEELSGLLSKYKFGHAIVSKTGKDAELETKLLASGIKVITLSPHLKLPIEILYETPETLGGRPYCGCSGRKCRIYQRTGA